MSVYDVLAERGFIEQVTDEAEARRILAGEPVSCYIGFDPTAASLHVGSPFPSCRWPTCSETATGPSPWSVAGRP